MKAFLNSKKVLILLPLISVFLFITILTAVPAELTSYISPQKNKTETADSYPEATKATESISPEETNKPKPETTTVTVDPNTLAIKAPVNSAPAKKSSTVTPPKKPSTQLSRSSSALTTPPSSTQTSKASAIIATAKKYIGVKYVYGGTSPSGFDCSGFVQYVFAKNGISLPRVSRDQFKAGTSVSFKNLKPGDLVFFSIAKNKVVDHVGIYVGNGQFINASSSKGVTIYPLGPYWQSAFVGGKRVL